MSEALQASTASPETQNPQEKIDRAFHDAQTSIYKFSSDPQFQAFCMDKKIDPFDDAGSEKYWDAAADFANERIATIRENGADSLKLRAFELLINTPSYIFSEYTAENPDTPYSQRQEASDRCCAFNTMLREFSAFQPDVSVRQTELAMAGIAGRAIDDRHVRQMAATYIRGTRISAQTENGTEQMLEATGRVFKHGDKNEDLRGIDEKVGAKLFPGQSFALDVKASMKQIINHKNPELPYAIRPDGIVTVFPLLSESDFGDSFFMSEESVQLKAPKFDELLLEIERERFAA